MKREFKEEIDVDIEVKDFLGISENIFVYNGKNAHEIIFFYNVSINESDFKEKYHIVDDNCETDAVWIDTDKFKNKELKIYPEKVLDYIS